jgi:cytochrome b subunit of formate dehydrogenase
MDPFRYAKNFFSDAYLPQQLTWQFGLFLLSLVAVMAGLVLIRRGFFGTPRRSATGAPPPPGASIFERYEIGARLWHIGLVGILLVLGVSGVAFYDPGSIPGPVPVIGMSWLYVHLAFGVFFMLGIVVHAFKAGITDLPSMLFNRRDWHDLAGTLRYYFGLSQELPKPGKYGVSSKLFHISLIVLALTMVVSGICLSLDTLGWAAPDQRWQRWQRLLHDVGTYGFLILVVGHVFWQLLKSWAQTKAMVTGAITADTFRAHHDWDRWKPHVLSSSSTAGKTTKAP